MKTPSPLLVLVVALVVGCRQQNNVHWTGVEEFEFNGAKIELPNGGKGAFTASAAHLDYRWDGKSLTIRDLGDGTVSVTTPAETDRIVDKAVVLVIDFEGNIATRSRKVPEEVSATDTNPHSVEPVRAPVEKELLRAIGKAWEHDFSRALEIIRSLYGRPDADQELILRAETAICAAQAANRLDTWEGSDFGKATPWFGGAETLWTDWEEQEDGSLIGTPRGDVSIQYFDMIIRHSLKRLKRVSNVTTSANPDAEQAGAEQPATRPESKSEASDKPQPEAEERSR